MTEEKETQQSTQGETTIRNPEKVYELLKQTQADLKEAQKAIKAFGGLTPEDVAELKAAADAQKEAQEKASEEKLKLEGQYAALAEKQIEAIKAQSAKEIEKLTKRITALESENSELNQQLTGERTALTETRAYSKALDAYLAAGGLKDGDDEESSFGLLWSRYKDKIMAVLGEEPPTDDKGKPVTLPALMESFKAKPATKLLFEGIQPAGLDTKTTANPQPASADRPREIKVSDMMRLKELGITPEMISSGKVVVKP